MGPDTREIMSELERLGTAQNRRIYARHGADEPLFGVSHKDVARLAKRIGRDQPLAERLWDSANHDARILAMQIAEPALVDLRTAERWLADATNHMLVAAVTKPLATAPGATALAASWRERPEEWPSSAGWALTAHLALRPEILDDAECEGLLATIEARITDAPNRTRHELNGVLIAIGSRGGAAELRARDAAARIGAVSVDHGETGCKTPAAIPYLDRIAARRAARA